MAEDKTLLSSAQVDEELKFLEGWSRKHTVISRDFVMDNFKDLTAFLNHLTRTITEMNHHPDFSLDTGEKTFHISVTTHSEKALTRADLDFARALNAWTPAR